MILMSKLNSCVPRILCIKNCLQVGGSAKQSHIRFKSMFPKFKVSEKSLRTQDGLPEQFTLIYRNTMNNYLLGAQIASVLSAGLVGVIVWIADASTVVNYEPRMDGWRVQPRPVDNELLVYCTAILALSVILQYFIKKMPLRIYNFNDEKYVFVYYNVFPFFTKKFSCGPNQIRKLASKSNPLLPWTESRYEVHHNYGTILIDTFFKNPAEMNIMLGLQKRFVEPQNDE